MLGHSRSSPRTSAVAALLLLGTGLAGQQRLGVAGRVLGVADRPLAGAEVTFVGSEPPLGDRFADADRVVATADERGRFRAELLVGSDYSGWAAGPPDSDGTRFVSEILDGVRAGTGIELRATHPRARCRLRLQGTEPWRDAGPLRVRAAVAAAHLHHEPLVFTDGLAELPPLPAKARWFVFVVDARDNVLHAERCDAQPGELVCTVAPPREIPVRVVDASGAPVAAVNLQWLVGNLPRSGREQLLEPPRRGTWQRVGTTGPDGTAVVRVPHRVDPFTAEVRRGLLLRASARDHAGAFGGWMEDRIVAERTDQPPAHELLFKLIKAPSWRVRILDGSGRPLAAESVQLAAGIVLQNKRGYAVPEVSFRPSPTADGWLVFEGLPAHPKALTLLVDAAPAGVADSAPPLARAPALLTPDLDQPLELDLRTLPVLTLKVLDAAGGPARNANVVMLPLPVDDWQPNDSTHTFLLGSAGTARTRVQAGRWSVFVTDRLGFLHTTVEIVESTELALQLQELAVMRGQVRTSGDVAGTAIEFRLNSSAHLNTSTDDEVLALHAVGRQVNWWLVAQTRVAADGSFTLHFVDVPKATFEGFVRTDGRSAPLRLHATAKPVEFDLRAK